MSWYPTDLVLCPKCRSRFSTPIDMLEHKKCCKIPGDGQGGIVAKLGALGSESVRVTRGRVELEKTISFTMMTGEKCRGRIWMINEAAVFIEIDVRYL